MLLVECSKHCKAKYRLVVQGYLLIVGMKRLPWQGLLCVCCSSRGFVSHSQWLDVRALFSEREIGWTCTVVYY